MEGPVPWARLVALIVPFYPKGERGILLREGTLVDATIIAALASTKNKTKERNPEMHQTRKGKQCRSYALKS